MEGNARTVTEHTIPGSLDSAAVIAMSPSALRSMQDTTVDKETSPHQPSSAYAMKACHQCPRSHCPVALWVESLDAVDGQVFVVVCLRPFVVVRALAKGFAVKLNGRVSLVAVCLSVVLRGIAGGFFDELEDRLFATLHFLHLFSVFTAGLFFAATAHDGAG
ncbi:hypothetical protein ACER0C_009697 [Sarotherodon galilaeus]